MHATAARSIRSINTLRAIDDACRGEIRSGQQLDEFRNIDFGLIDQRQGSVDDFAKIVRNVRRHADGDA